VKSSKKEKKEKSVKREKKGRSIERGYSHHRDRNLPQIVTVAVGKVRMAIVKGNSSRVTDGAVVTFA
jgi:hypothetical protein